MNNQGASTRPSSSILTHSPHTPTGSCRESQGYPCREVAVELGRKLGKQVIDLPGGHVGCMTRPAEFATELMQAL